MQMSFPNTAVDATSTVWAVLKQAAKCTRLLALTLFASIGGFVQATSVVPPQFPELVNEADYIVRAVVKSVQPHERVAKSGATLVFSSVELDVKAVIAGRPPAPLVLVVLGGKAGDKEMAIAGAPEFSVGDEAIFFIQGNERQIFPLVRIMHGLYPVKKQDKGREYITRSDGEALKDVTEVSREIHLPSVGPAGAPTAADALSPEEFVQKIRGAITKESLRAN